MSNQERLQSYLSLINQLLTCSNGQEHEILNANQNLIDAGLVQTMERVVCVLIQKGADQQAEWLRQLAGQLESTLGTNPALDNKDRIADKRIKSFGARFGREHLYLAYHAAFPLALTPDLLYKIWANFQRDIDDRLLNIPWEAVADVLLSSLCKEVGSELYEMDVAVRNVLLNELKANPGFGEERLKNLSDFVLEYIQEQIHSDDSNVRDFAQVQKWTALAYTKPDKAARELALALREKLQEQNKAELVRMASVVETLAEPLMKFEPLIVYSRKIKKLAKAKNEEVVEIFRDLVKSKEFIRILDIILPIPSKSENLWAIKDSAIYIHQNGISNKYQYLDVIEELLKCPLYEEPKVLKFHKTLINKTLVRQIKIVADLLSNKYSQKSARFLKDLGNSLAFSIVLVKQISSNKAALEKTYLHKQLLIGSDVIYSLQLKGQGVASKLLNEEDIFSPKCFKSTLRGHALRIFGGLTDEGTANYLVERLFGYAWGQAFIKSFVGSQKSYPLSRIVFHGKLGEAIIELLGMDLRETSLHLNTFDQAYGSLNTEAQRELGWLLMQYLPNIEREFFATETTLELLNTSFIPRALNLSKFNQGFREPIYEVEGELSWLSVRKLADPDRKTLQRFLKALTRFTMLLGGFGKSWQRADHRLFYPDYYETANRKPLIGCHWEWTHQSLIKDNRVRKLEQVGSFIEDVRQAAVEWMELEGITPNAKQKASWFEVWHPETVQVWGRLAEDAEDSQAIHWFHQPYEQKAQLFRNRRVSIHRSNINGLTGQSNRIWHRMYPLIRLAKNPENPKKPIPKRTSQYLELVTFFPENSSESIEFSALLHQSEFQKLWPL